MCSLHRQASVVEHGQHGAVLGQRVRDEASNTHLTGASCQVLEEERAQPASLPAVGYDERHLGVCSAARHAVEAGDTDDLARDDCHDGLAVAVVDVSEAVQLGLAQLGVEGEEPSIGRLR